MSKVSLMGTSNTPHLVHVSIFSARLCVLHLSATDRHRQAKNLFVNFLKLFFIGALFLFLTDPLWPQEISFESMQALIEWRWGVVAYNDGLPGKSLLAMERANSLNPTDPKIKEWLGWAYWKSGEESSALSIWDELIEKNEASLSLKDRADWLRRRIAGGESDSQANDEWISMETFQGGGGLVQDFKQPVAARSLRDNSGALIVTSYSGGELVQIDANGAFVEHYEGGIEGFIRPFDVLPLDDDRLLVSEFQANRLAIINLKGVARGYRVETWGDTGKGMNQFLGPQFMALSPDRQFFYVSDWGNRRVAKWSIDGTHILNLTGVQGPSGIACLDDMVYVADSLRARVDVFDSSGNYRGPLLTEGLDKPEGLSLYENFLLIADGANIMQVELDSGELSLKASLGDGIHRITSVFPDENGNLVVCDFDDNRVHLLVPLSSLYNGLEINLERVRADAFPNIFVDLTVKDRRGIPLTGLNETNFRVLDGEIPIGQPQIDWQSFKDSSVSIVAVVDSFGDATESRKLLRGIEDMNKALVTGDKLAFVEASEKPLLYEIQKEEGIKDFFRTIIAKAGPKQIQWDEALRLAANRIAADRIHKAIIAFVHTPPADTAFDTFGLVETARLMANNGIVFYPFYADPDIVSRELDYIAEETQGHSFFLFQPKGSGIAIDRLRQKRTGRYTISWESPHSGGFGRDYLPVSVEVIYYSKSGRAESGTFTPLQ